MKPDPLQRFPTRQRISESELCAWLARATPGDVLEYHRGFLGVDLTPFANPMSPEARAGLARTSARAYDLAGRGFVHLVQHRLDADSFSYRAIARPHAGRTPIAFETLMSEEAA